MYAGDRGMHEKLRIDQLPAQICELKHVREYVARSRKPTVGGFMRSVWRRLPGWEGTAGQAQNPSLAYAYFEVRDSAMVLDSQIAFMKRFPNSTQSKR